MVSPLGRVVARVAIIPSVEPLDKLDWIPGGTNSNVQPAQEQRGRHREHQCLGNDFHA